MATEQSTTIPESSPDSPSAITQQHTEDEAAHRQSIEIDSKGGWVYDGGKPEGTFDTGDGDDTAATTDSILPPVTPAILEEYQKEQALKEKVERRRGMDRIKNSKIGCCGIPSCLMLVMIGLVLAVVG
ncbi:MAG: hypothetical protein SGILL_006439, partial [Bacillariaceae sp.]